MTVTWTCSLDFKFIVDGGASEESVSFDPLNSHTDHDSQAPVDALNWSLPLNVLPEHFDSNYASLAPAINSEFLPSCN